MSNRFHVVSVAAVGLLAWVTACTEYTTIAQVDVAGYDEVRATTVDGERQLFVDPSIEADSLRGYPDQEAADASEKLAVPLSRIVVIQARELNVANTVVLGAVLGGIVVGWYLLAHAE